MLCFCLHRSIFIYLNHSFDLEIKQSIIIIIRMEVKRTVKYNIDQGFLNKEQGEILFFYVKGS
jgi:hypothetical protein